jgi:transcription elongation factor GreB
MNKAFTKEESEDEGLSLQPDMPYGVRNYITPAGYQHLQNELLQLLDVARPRALQADTADNPDAESAGSQPQPTLREIEQRIHYLQTRLETAEVVDPAIHAGEEQIFFGAIVTYQNESAEQQTVTIVGLDEIDPAHGRISWLSPVARALLGACEGDTVLLESPAGDENLEILAVRYS